MRHHAISRKSEFLNMPEIHIWRSIEYNKLEFHPIQITPCLFRKSATKRVHRKSVPRVFPFSPPVHQTSMLCTTIIYERMPLRNWSRIILQKWKFALSRDSERWRRTPVFWLRGNAINVDKEGRRMCKEMRRTEIGPNGSDPNGVCDRCS